MRLRNAGFPRQAGAGSSLTSSSKLNTLDFLHQPLPPGTEKRAGWPWGLAPGSEALGVGKRWGQRETSDGCVHQECASVFPRPQDMRV